MVATNYNTAIVWSIWKYFRASHKNHDCNKFVLWSNKRIKNIHFILVAKYSYACLFYLQKQVLVWTGIFTGIFTDVSNVFHFRMSASVFLGNVSEKATEGGIHFCFDYTGAASFT